jgi:hypothetical protein
MHERMKTKLLLVALAVLLIMLAVTNPTVEQFRGHLRERGGIAATLGLFAADLLTHPDSANSAGGVKRESFLFFSRFYIGGDGLLPRQDLAWGVAGRFIDRASDADSERKK